MMKGSTHKKETLTLNVSVPNNRFKIWDKTDRNGKEKHTNPMVELEISLPLSQ